MFVPTWKMCPLNILLKYTLDTLYQGFLGGSDDKETACSAGDPCSNPGPGRSLGEGNGNQLQCHYLENSIDRGAWQAAIHGTAETDMTE